MNGVRRHRRVHRRPDLLRPTGQRVHDPGASAPAPHSLVDLTPSQRRSARDLIRRLRSPHPTTASSSAQIPQTRRPTRRPPRDRLASVAASMPGHLTIEFRRTRLPSRAEDAQDSSDTYDIASRSATPISVSTRRSALSASVPTRHATAVSTNPPTPTSSTRR